MCEGSSPWSGRATQLRAYDGWTVGSVSTLDIQSQCNFFGGGQAAQCLTGKAEPHRETQELKTWPGFPEEEA